MVERLAGRGQSIFGLPNCGGHKSCALQPSRLRRRFSRFGIGVVDVGLLRSGGC